MIDLSKIELKEDRILIKPDPPQKQTSGGLLLSTSAQKKPDTGEVVLIGKGLQAEQTGVLIEMYVKVGDRVIFDKFNATEFGEYLLARQGAVTAIIDKK